MAHKKAGGSSRNGRDSAGRRLGLKLFGGQMLSPATFSRVSVAPLGMPAPMSAWARITRFSHSSTDALHSIRKPKAARSSPSYR